MKVRYLFLLVTALTVGCGDGSDTPTSPSSPDGGGGVTSAPSVTCPSNVSASTTTTTAQVAFPAPTVSGGTAPVTVACTPTSGASFPLGATTVSCTATDSIARTATCSFSVTVSRIPTLQRTRFLAFGDSVTAGEVSVPTSGGTDLLGPPNFTLVLVPSAAYPAQLQSMLRNRYVTQSNAITVVNSGVSGEYAVDSVKRFSQVMSSVRPEVVLLLDGYNDLNNFGSSAIGSTAAAVEAMAKDARNRGARVYIASLTPPRAGGRNAIPASTIATYNDRMRAIAAGENAVFVDLYQALVSNVTTFVGVDGLHLTEVGYQKVAETFFAAIQATLQNP
jgi:lysophospholipase L1-like esterase